MAETNKSQLMSEAEIIEAINADSLISVSLGAGQPQKNVKMSTLASVAAGLMNGFFKQGGSVNANEDIDPGMYQNPQNAPNAYGMLVVFRTSGVRLQFFINTDGNLYTRSMSVSGWTSWKQIA